MINAFVQSTGLLILRVGLGAMMLTHGWPKLQSADPAGFSDPINLGPHLSWALVVFAEFFCSVLLVLGLGTRFAAIPLATTMLVAALIFHANDPFNKKELALVYLTGFTSLMIMGGGMFSLDRWLWLLFFRPKSSKS